MKNARRSPVLRQSSIRWTMSALMGASLLAVALWVISCSQEQSSSEPEPVAVSMWGHADFPSESVDPEQVTVGFGEYESAPGATGAFTIQGNPDIAGLAVAHDEEGTPLLMAIQPDPQDGAGIILDAHSTALALAFLNPFVCVSDPEGAAEALTAPPRRFA